MAIATSRGSIPQSAGKMATDSIRRTDSTRKNGAEAGQFLLHSSAQMFPQLPQLSPSVCSFTQRPAHKVCPVGHGAQVPFWLKASPAGHGEESFSAPCTPVANEVEVRLGEEC